MAEATDICSVCDKVDDLRSMEYLRPEMPFDDRLICEQCKRDTYYKKSDLILFVSVYSFIFLGCLGLLFYGVMTQ